MEGVAGAAFLRTAEARRKRAGNEGMSGALRTSERTWYGMSPLLICDSDIVLRRGRVGRKAWPGYGAKVVVIIS